MLHGSCLLYIAMQLNLKYSSVVVYCIYATGFEISRLTIVSREAKKKQAVHDERVSYLHVALL